jgi:hypothetical protein
MAEIDQTIAAQGRPIQSQAPDIVGTIDSLAKLSYYADLGRQAEANAGLINQQTLAAQAGFAANQEQYSRLKQGANPEDVAAPLAVFNGQGAKVGLSIRVAAQRNRGQHGGPCPTSNRARSAGAPRRRPSSRSERRSLREGVREAPKAHLTRRCNRA